MGKCSPSNSHDGGSTQTDEDKLDLWNGSGLCSEEPVDPSDDDQWETCYRQVKKLEAHGARTRKAWSHYGNKPNVLLLYVDDFVKAVFEADSLDYYFVVDFLLSYCRDDLRYLSDVLDKASVEAKNDLIQLVKKQIAASAGTKSDLITPSVSV